jgi:hypothetical protein
MGKLKTEIGERLPPRVIMLGAHGVGKTTFGSESGKPVFVVTEDGASNIPVQKVMTPSGIVARVWDEFYEAVNSVLTEEHDFDTLVIDTLNGAAGLLANHVCRTQYGGRWAAEKGQRSYLAFGEGPKSTAEESKRFLNLLDAIRSNRGMKILLLTHRGIVNIRNPRLGDYHQFAGDMPLVIWNVFAQWADVVALADYDMAVLPREGRGTGVPAGTTTRIVRCGGSVAEDTKCRVGYEVPEEMEFDAKTFWPTIGRDETTIKEVKANWSLLSKEQQKAAMEWLGVKKLDDASIRSLRKLVDRMRKIKIEQANKQEVETAKEESNA